MPTTTGCAAALRRLAHLWLMVGTAALRPLPLGCRRAWRRMMADAWGYGRSAAFAHWRGRGDDGCSFVCVSVLSVKGGASDTTDTRGHASLDIHAPCVSSDDGRIDGGIDGRGDGGWEAAAWRPYQSIATGEQGAERTRSLWMAATKEERAAWRSYNPLRRGNVCAM